ncbi:MAG TPA: hypothetical protein VJ995_03570 [Geothermobacteraceae bacterium]|nr:hypothetical protein [Geothermobacteraceae bacterium]
MKKMRLSMILLLSIPILFTACSDSNTEAPPLGQVHPLAWLNPASADFHGKAFLAPQPAAQGKESCTSCHGLDLRGSGSVPGCNKCHFSLTDFTVRVPEGSTWTHGTTPHSEFLAQGETCNACHTALRQFPGQGPGNCHDCHAVNMHPLGQAWLDRSSATFHGLSASADSDQCATCHGSDFQGGIAGVSCYLCHFGPTGSKVPAGESWTHGTVPHNTAGLTDAISICNQCHTTSRLYGNGPNACHDCHVGATHPVGQAWLDVNSATFHGAAAQADVNSCAACHGADFQGGSAGVSCYKCHFGPTGSKIPAGESWSHGTVPHNTTALIGSSAVCNQCHDTSRLYGNGPNACHDCHASATHPVGQAWLDVNSATFHGAAATADVVSCQACHGADYQGGISGVSCSQCHFGPAGDKVPAGETWTHGTVPHNTTALTDSIAICNQCHDISRLYGNGPATCHDCHTVAPHPTGQAWLDPNSATFHGTDATVPDGCTSCHGSDWLGGSSGVSCMQCHFGPTGSRVPPAEGSWVHGTIPHNTANFTAASAICNQCHNLNRSYGNPPAACHDCHLGVSHPKGQAWLDPNSATFHGDAALADIDSCKQCHGADYLGGIAGRSCSECHFGPTGSRVPSGSGWAHGTIPHNSLATSIAVCNACHDLNRSFGNGPSSCHDCHGSGGSGHVTGAAWMDKSLTTFHGNSSLDCTLCHGADLTGGTTGVSCYQCHFDPTGRRTPVGSSWTHGRSGHTSYSSYQTVCINCHTTNQTYGNQSSCHNCH